MSRLNSLSWILVGVFKSNKVFLFFFVLYSILLLGVVVILSYPYCSSFLKIQGLKRFEKLIIFFIFLSLAGLPPFLGFLAKVVVIKNVIYFSRILILIVLVFRSLMILSFYLNICHLATSLRTKLNLEHSLNYGLRYKLRYFFSINFIWCLFILFS